MTSTTNTSSLPKGALAALSVNPAKAGDAAPTISGLPRLMVERKKHAAGFYLLLIQHTERQRRMARHWSRFPLSV